MPVPPSSACDGRRDRCIAGGVDPIRGRRPHRHPSPRVRSAPASPEPGYPRSPSSIRAHGRSPATRPAPRRRPSTFADLGMSDAWAKEGIVWVAKTNSWMLDFAPNADGTYDFRPDAIETRKYFARSVVRAFAPDEEPDPTIVFDDLDASSPVVSLRGRRRRPRVDDRSQRRVRSRRSRDDGHGAPGPGARARARPRGQGAQRIHTRDGVTFKTPSTFGTNVLGMRLGLRYNAPTGSESTDVAPKDRMPRAQVAYSLWRATTQPSWNVPEPPGAVRERRVAAPRAACAGDRAMGDPVRGLPLHLGRRVGPRDEGALGARRPTAQRVRLLRLDLVAAPRR